MKIVNFEKFKEQCSTYDKQALKALLDYFAFKRILEELAIVDAIRKCHADGKPLSKAEMITDYNNALEGERIIIGFLGRQESAKVYGRMEGITSDIKTVDYVLSQDAVYSLDDDNKT